MNSPQNLPEKLRNMDWYAIACKLRAKYEELKEKAANLENSLLGYHKEIEIKDTVINKQNQDLDAHKQTIKKLYNQLEDVADKVKSQQLLLEGLTQDLKDSQTQRGRIERECSLLQENFNQLQYQVREKEKENQELNVRLQRQQRSTLEYKAALDKYLHSSSDKPKVTNFEKETIKSWSEVRSSKDNPQNPSISQLSNFAIAPVPDFVNIPLLNQSQKLTHQSSDSTDTTKEEEKNHSNGEIQPTDSQPNLDLKKTNDQKLDNTDIKKDEISQSNLDIASSESVEIKENQENKVKQKLENNSIKKNIDLLSGIKPSKDDNKDKKIVIDLPDFFKNNRDNS